MGIKWDDVRLGTDFFNNEIIIGKAKKLDNGLLEMSDKSEKYFTEQCVKATMEHMIGKAKDEKSKKFVYEIKGKVRLICENLED